VEADVWHVYVVRVADGSLYTGISTDVERRVAEHARAGGRGAKYLRGRGPLELVFRTEVGSRARALRVERGLKRLSKARKERIVTERPELARLLSMLDLSPEDGS
jgi:putative endonuclease